jgi:hypothetical protein
MNSNSFLTAISYYAKSQMPVRRSAILLIISLFYPETENGITGGTAPARHSGLRAQECHQAGPGMEKGHHPEGGGDAPHRQHQQADPQGPEGGA